jgi:hypothetical protein
MQQDRPNLLTRAAYPVHSLLERCVDRRKLQGQNCGLVEFIPVRNWPADTLKIHIKPAFDNGDRIDT